MKQKDTKQRKTKTAQEIQSNTKQSSQHYLKENNTQQSNTT
jgi:hypothetical protein